jgi:hypothetical protein
LSFLEKAGDVMTLKKQPLGTLFTATLVLVLLLSCTVSTGYAQTLPTFDRGSTGSEGALSLTTPGTYFFDPSDTALFGKVLDPDGDGIFNFTTINIAAGVTLRFRGDRYNRPVFWLASGTVSIAGTLDLKGDNFAQYSPITDLDARRRLTVPGSGGFSGGSGGNSSIPATPGDGPGGGTRVTCVFGTNACGVSGTFAGTNRYLVPLIGGSGGGGATIVLNNLNSNTFYMGAAGGGAILIASSISISIQSPGQIDARGGNSDGASGAGSGGAVRLVAPTISSFSTTRIFVNQGGTGNGGSDGRARLEAFQYLINGSAVATGGAMVSGSLVTSGFPISVYLPSSSVRIVSIDGQAVSATPAGNFLKPPDVTINKTAAVPVVVQAVGIPTSTPIKVIVYSDNPDDPLTVSTTYSGTLDSSLQSVVNVPFPFGLSRSYIRVTWTQ